MGQKEGRRKIRRGRGSGGGRAGVGAGALIRAGARAEDGGTSRDA